MTEQKYKDPEYLREAYWNRRLSTREMADESDCSGRTIIRWMEHHGIDRRSVSEARGPLSLKTHPRGYEWFQGRDNGDPVHIYHHRLLAVAHYGFDSVAECVVHHRNNIPWDNRPENIELLPDETHKQIHATEQERTDRGTFAEVTHGR